MLTRYDLFRVGLETHHIINPFWSYPGQERVFYIRVNRVNRSCTVDSVADEADFSPFSVPFVTEMAVLHPFCLVFLFRQLDNPSLSFPTNRK